MKAANFHFRAYLSSPGSPAYVGPCAYDGDEGLKEGDEEEHLVFLGAASLKVHCCQDAGARACDDACDGDVAAEPHLLFHSSQRHIFTKAFIFWSHERAVSTCFFTVSNLNSFFYIWES